MKNVTDLFGTLLQNQKGAQNVNLNKDIESQPTTRILQPDFKIIRRNEELPFDDLDKNKFERAIELTKYLIERIERLEVIEAEFSERLQIGC